MQEFGSRRAAQCKKLALVACSQSWVSFMQCCADCEVSSTAQSSWSGSALKPTLANEAEGQPTSAQLPVISKGWQCPLMQGEIWKALSAPPFSDTAGLQWFLWALCGSPGSAAMPG